MAIDAVAPDAAAPRYREAPRPVYEGQPYYTFDEVVEEFSFWDLVDIINPLQHIPLVNHLYREITGDQIGSFAQVAGGALFGGPMGAIFGVANMVVRESTGKDAAQLVMAAFTEDLDSPAGLGGTADVETLAASAPIGADLLADLGPGAQAGAQTGAPALAGLPATAGAATQAPGGVFGGVTVGGMPATASAMLATDAAVPLGGLLLANEAGRVAADQAAARGVREPVPTLDGAQSAALAAFVAHHTGGPRGEGAARGGGIAAPAALDGAARAGVAGPTDSSMDQQSEDMSQNPQQNPARDDSDRAAASSAAARADDGLPADIRQGREALRARLAAARAESDARADGMPGGASADGRPTGMTLADYRARPNPRAGEGRATPPPAAVGAAPAGVLPDAAAMAGLLQRGERVAAAADDRARRAADGTAARLTIPVTPAPDSAPPAGAFRALPVDGPVGGAPTEATGRPAGTGDGPVATQPWFSQRVLDAMRRYDAARAGEAGAAAS
ncbi:hypothetical protein [Roseospira goensis]|uniref:Uncharacterized protein n=1 Tax=Roseospira goensis TaxID=391922 RepID=A0A7W6WLR1_9PROT|nr:hypothetical protein [Roseospira goensis]MBB4286682.1 hypothetical protein [Roseospira goensis]